MRSGRHFLHAALDPGATHALGVLLLERGDELQVAAPARAARDPRLRGGARGGASRGARPLGPLLAPARVAGAGVSRARALAAPQRPGAAALVVVRGPRLSLRVLGADDVPALFEL